jgi:hypothetical protein
VARSKLLQQWRLWDLKGPQAFSGSTLPAGPLSSPSSPPLSQWVQAACDTWTERLRGMRFDPEMLYHICEHTFTTVEGPRIPLPFQQQHNGASVPQQALKESAEAKATS